MTAGPETVNDDFEGDALVEVWRDCPREVGVSQSGCHVAVLACVEEKLGVDLFRRRRQHVKVVEGTVIAETPDFRVADNLLITFVSPVSEGESSM